MSVSNVFRLSPSGGDARLAEASSCIDCYEKGLLEVRGVLLRYNIQSLLIRSSSRGDDAVEHTSVNEEQIAEALKRVPRNRWREVLDFIGSLQTPAKVEIRTPPVSEPAPEKQWTPEELRKLPAEQRDAILAEQAAQLEEEYRNNPELISFEAFGQDDLHVDSSNTETR